MDKAALTRNLRVYVPLLLTPAIPWLGVLPAGRWWVPLVAPLTLYSAFLARVHLRDYVGAWRLGIAWAALLSLGVISMVLLSPSLAEGAVLNGEPYRQEMFHWIDTGEGAEGEPALFLPIHALHLAVFVALTWISAGYLGLALGAVLLGYMSYFVASYAAAAGSPVLGSLLAWVPWSVIRVMAFVLLGCLFARPLVVRRPWPFGPRETRLLWLAVAGLLADVTLKALTADGYGLLLRQLAGGSLP